jgi:ferredoxin-nitrite reductase
MDVPAVDGFTEEQKQYLDGFVSGGRIAQSLPVLPTWQKTLGTTPQPQPSESDRKLPPEEQAKRRLHGLDTWNLVLEHARDGRFPKGTDVFMMKFQGMFYVAPAQESFMCRLRLPGGFVSSAQFRGVADVAERFGGGYADVTTRANLQIREIGPRHTVDVLMGLHDLGIVNRGAGADNIRNITCSPTAGIDPQELIDTRDLARRMHHYILNHRDMFGLPRKFNIAFDGGGRVSALEDTNDIGFTAVRRKNGSDPVFPLDIGFRLTLGGITGHKDFARDTGIMLTADECVPVAASIVKAFIEHGDRTDRKKARLKYVLDRMGFDGFIAEIEKHHGGKLRRFPLEHCEPRPAVVKHGHLGFHVQKQPGLYYVGVALPVGRMTCDQMRRLADIADRYGSGTIRLTVWQNLLISDIPSARIDDVKCDIEQAGLAWSATSIRGGLVACTGNAGCRFAASNTKLHAREIADSLEARLELDQPINIHLTGCPHSCAQHFIGDIGLLATKVPAGEDMIEGYHIYIGGGYGEQRGIGREIYRNVPASDAPAVIERVLRAYVAERQSPQESFLQFVRRLPTDALVHLFDAEGVTP